MKKREKPPILFLSKDFEAAQKAILARRPQASRLKAMLRRIAQERNIKAAN